MPRRRAWTFDLSYLIYLITLAPPLTSLLPMPNPYIRLVDMSSPSSSVNHRDNVPDYGTTSDTSPAVKYSDSINKNAVSDTDSGSDSSNEEQAGVKAISAVARIWTPWSLVFAYTGYASLFPFDSLASESL